MPISFVLTDSKSATIRMNLVIVAMEKYYWSHLENHKKAFVMR